jgi:hypothetical protein
MSEEIKIVELINTNSSPLWALVEKYGRLLTDDEYDSDETYWLEKAKAVGAVLVIILGQDEGDDAVIAFDFEGMPVSI